MPESPEDFSQPALNLSRHRRRREYFDRKVDRHRTAHALPTGFPDPNHAILKKAHCPPGGRSVKLISWNVNGLRAVQDKGFFDFFHEYKPDILCLQETRLGPELADTSFAVPDGYHAHWVGAKKKGYSGVGILSKEMPLSWQEGLGDPQFDDEGRTLTAEYPEYFVVAAYFPNSQHELLRLDYKMAYNRAFLAFCEKRRKKKPVIFCGDLNVAHEEIDLANPKSNTMNPGFYIDERNWFTGMLEAGYVDTFRAQHPEPDQYSWWSYRFNARKKNIGWRIDYVVVSKELAPRVNESFILQSVMGSDHCPVGIVFS